MSVIRTIVRMAVVSALNNFSSAPWPTIAGLNIFDSKIEPVEDMKQSRAFPCCVVYTDYDKDHWNKAGFAHADRNLTVTIELLIVQTVKENSDGTRETYSLECPTTDPEIENSLDFMESQVFRALSANTVSANCFNLLCPNYSAVISRRGASVEGGQRLAARQLTLEMKALRDSPSAAIPAAVEAFLQEAERSQSLKDRIPDIRRFISVDQGAGIGEIAARTFGYGSSVLNALGMQRDGLNPMPVLPPNLIFLNQNGGPI